MGYFDAIVPFSYIGPLKFEESRIMQMSLNVVAACAI